MLHLKHNIRLIRDLTGKTQEEFAGLFKRVTVAMQKSYESGKASPGPAYLQKLADYAGVTHDDLLNKDLKIQDVEIEEDVEKGENRQKRLTDRNLIGMFLTVSSAQTELLGFIKNEMAQKEIQATIKDKVEELGLNLIEALSDLDKISATQNKSIERVLDEFAGLHEKIESLRAASKRRS